MPHPGSGRYVGRYQYDLGGLNLCKSTDKHHTRHSPHKLPEKGQASGSQYDYASWCAVWSTLYLVVSIPNWDSQSKIGNGIVGNSSLQKTGTTDSMTYHTGTVACQDRLWRRVQYRGIEKPVGQCL